MDLFEGFFFIYVTEGVAQVYGFEQGLGLLIGAEIQLEIAADYLL